MQVHDTHVYMLYNVIYVNTYVHLFTPEKNIFLVILFFPIA